MYLSGNSQLAISIGKPYWNNGYAFEAAKEVISHAFEDLNMKTIWCGYYYGNERSKHIQEKLGFELYRVCDNDVFSQLMDCRASYLNRLTKEKWTAMNIN